MSTFIDFQDLKERYSIEEVASLLGLKLKLHGKSLRCCCPIHQGSDPREFVITPDKGMFYCQTCHKGGDMIKLYALVRDMDQKESAFAIEKGLGTVTVDSTVHSTDVDPSNVKKVSQPVAFLRPLDYLVFKHDAVQALGIDPETAEYFGAGYAPKGIMRGRLAIPIHDADGVLLAYCGRTLKQQDEKLTFPNGFDNAGVLFNVHRCSEGLVEIRRDPLDVLLSFQYGLENIVSVLTDDISSHQLRIFADFLDANNSYN